MQAILDIEFIPLVISKIPVKILEMKVVSILKRFVIGVKQVVNKFNIPLDCRIEIILEKITTNPPIKRIVEMLLVILSANTSPKFEKLTSFLEFVVVERLLRFL